ncbi:MAG TPA: cytochrome c oxidase assembly factor Coa1 family protein [Thermoanaerobaculia bacterium]|nr:cytochrome c oxidase assembly factor Coa1 family protein [Thermoanaerobaculia bacterium]
MPGKPTNPLVWVGVGCGIALAGLVAFIAFIVFVAFGALRASEPYTNALSRAQRDPRVIAALGAPVEAGWLVSGKIQVDNRDGHANLDIHIAGPKQKAVLRVIGTKARGRWVYDEMIVTPENGPEINLLTSSGGSPRTEPPGG